jgi:hypothetical protein
MGRLTIAALLASLVSCGGGGGGDSPPADQPEWAGSWTGTISPLALGLFLIDAPESCTLDLSRARDGRVSGRMVGSNRIGDWVLDLEGVEDWRPGIDYLLQLAGETAGTHPSMNGRQVGLQLSWSLQREDFVGEFDANGVRGAARLVLDR